MTRDRKLWAEDVRKLTREFARVAIIQVRAIGASEMGQGGNVGKVDRCGAGLLRDLVVKDRAREQLLFDFADAAAAREDDEDHFAAVRLNAGDHLAQVCDSRIQ